VLSTVFRIFGLLSSIKRKCFDASNTHLSDDTVAYIRSYVHDELVKLYEIWPKGLEPKHLDACITAQNNDNWPELIINNLLPEIELQLESYYSNQRDQSSHAEFVDLLHPAIISSSFHQFRNGHYREAVLNSVIAVFDLLRKKTGIDEDGSRLACRIFSIEKPVLRLNSLLTESERDEQKGFLQILQGAYQGIRNPKAHTLETDINEKKAGQYLVFSSLLARRIDEAY
jgi:uncharacterized protein (TIGR02391 family)